MSGDWRLLTGAVALGVLWGVGRDLSRLFRLSLGRPVSGVTASYGHPPKKHPRLAVTPGQGRVWLFFHDALSLLLLGVSFRLLLFFLTDGSFRLYALAGALGGFALWCGTLGRLWKKWVLPAAFLLRVSVGMLLLGLTLPLRLSLRLLLRLWDRLRLASYRRRAVRYGGVRPLFENVGVGAHDDPQSKNFMKKNV